MSSLRLWILGYTRGAAIQAKVRQEFLFMSSQKGSFFL